MRATPVTIALMLLGFSRKPHSVAGHVLTPAHTDLHWRGDREFTDRPWTEPLTRVYGRVKAKPDWTLTANRLGHANDTPPCFPSDVLHEQYNTH